MGLARGVFTPRSVEIGHHERSRAERKCFLYQRIGEDTGASEVEIVMGVLTDRIQPCDAGAPHWYVRTSYALGTPRVTKSNTVPENTQK